MSIASAAAGTAGGTTLKICNCCARKSILYGAAAAAPPAPLAPEPPPPEPPEPAPPEPPPPEPPPPDPPPRVDFIGCTIFVDF